MNWFLAPASVVLAVAVLLPGGVAESQGAPKVNPLPAGRAIADLLGEYDIVAIGESHSMTEAGRLYVRLIRNRAFQEAADDIVVEFGNARYQSMMDRYIMGGSVSKERLTRAWRDTTQVGAWDAPMYRRLFAAVRRANLTLRASEKLRVVLADPPIDWARVDTFRDWDRVAISREPHFARVIRREVLAKGRKALFIAGLLHVQRGASETIELLDEFHPGSTFVVATHLGFPNLQWERELYAWDSPTLARLEGTWIGNLPRGDGIASDTYDGLLYLGNPAFLQLSEPLPTLYRNDEYWRTLRRRHEIVLRRSFDPRAVFGYSARYPDSGIDEREVARLFAFSECVRTEGVAVFPDPQTGFDFLGWEDGALNEAKEDPDYERASTTCAERVGLAFVP